MSFQYLIINSCKYINSVIYYHKIWQFSMKRKRLVLGFILGISSDIRKFMVLQ